MNSVSLIGRLTRDIELKYTPSGTAMGRFVLARNRRVPNQNGVREVDFISCIIWNKGAENLARYTRKGSLIGVQGRLQTGSYDNKQGQKVYTTDVVVENFDFLESAKDKDNNVPSNRENQNDYENFDIDDDDLPF